MIAIIGIDPGKTGAIGVLWSDGEYEVHDMPQIGGDYDAPGLANLFRTLACRQAFRIVVERQRHMRGDAAQSSSGLFYCVGMVDMAAAMLGHPVERVDPAKWQKVMYSGESRAERAVVERVDHPAKCKCDVCKAARKEHARRRAEGKLVGLRVARRLFPLAPLTRVKDEGRAAALLIAEYGRRTLMGGVK